MLDGYPALQEVVRVLDDYLQTTYPDFFTTSSSHPYLSVKPFKVIHDPIWGTNSFTWWELALIDSPILQRLRGIHQTGLVNQIYPSAHHTRFEHSLGVLTIASRIFDALVERSSDVFRNIVRSLFDNGSFAFAAAQLRQELRLAALLHDTGHSLYSHTSELVYQDIPLIQRGSAELSTIAGKEKGAGEVLSFCLAHTASLQNLLAKAASKVSDKPSPDEVPTSIDLKRVALYIIGRSPHPFLQFLGDIVSSGLDADKLDYLLRDAISSGLPMRYDLERYLYAARIVPERLADGRGFLEKLYATGNRPPEKKPAQDDQSFPFFESYRLRLSKAGMSTFEQIIICKMMLFGYIYHHPKVRAAEGMLATVLRRQVSLWSKSGESDDCILKRFLSLTDAALQTSDFTASSDSFIRQYVYRINTRLLPREVYGLAGTSASGAEGALLRDFLLDLQNKSKRGALVSTLENAIGEELLRIEANLANSPEDARLTAGVWVDVPKPPKFEDVETRISGMQGGSIQFSQIFPVERWTQAYTSHRYYVRVFSFSEFAEITSKAAERAMQRIIKVSGTDFYKSIRRKRH